jgi:hypothetical protein
MISNDCRIAPKKGEFLMDGFLYRKDRFTWTTGVVSLKIRHFQMNIISYTLLFIGPLLNKPISPTESWFATFG